MNKLYNKIYKAVNEGIQKALLIDPDQNDVSINYSYSKINNESNLLSFYVNNLLNGNNEAYYDILKYCENTHSHYIYKIKDFQELNTILNIVNDINLSWVNTENIITCIMDDNNELPLHKITNKDKVIFIKLNNIDKFDHPIIIHKKLLVAKKMWSVHRKFMDIYDKDNGYENMDNIKNKIENKEIFLEEYPAFEYCINLKHYLNYEAYLPSINELKFLQKNINLLNYILNYINGQQLDINLGQWWSSTEFSKVSAQFISDNNSYGTTYKKNESYILPFFAKIN